MSSPYILSLGSNITLFFLSSLIQHLNLFFFPVNHSHKERLRQSLREHLETVKRNHVIAGMTGATDRSSHVLFGSLSWREDDVITLNECLVVLLHQFCAKKNEAGERNGDHKTKSTVATSENCGDKLQFMFHIIHLQSKII